MRKRGSRNLPVKKREDKIQKSQANLLVELKSGIKIDGGGLNEDHILDLETHPIDDGCLRRRT